MIKLPSHCQILIVGAGPSGLMMAAQLLRFGLQPLVVDVKTGINQQSRALAVQPRSLEIFRQLGLEKRLLEHGNMISGLSAYEDTELLGTVSLDADSGVKSKFPYVLVLEQSKTEQILLDYLTAHACPVYWNCELLEIQMKDKGTRVLIRNREEVQELDCDWLIGADGASSGVRQMLGFNFSGGTYLNRFYLADLTLRREGPANQVQVFLRSEGFIGVFPMKNDRYRFIGVLPETLEKRKDLLFAEIKPYLTYTLGFPIQDEVCNWFSVYQLHHRIADRFRRGTCFLIGDAAHIHSPVGGQGMNTGLQDAYNLAWKLAGVIMSEFDRGILSTYQAERLPVAAKLLKTTDRFFSIAVSRNWLIRRLRGWLLSKVLNWKWKGKAFPAGLFSQIAQTNISYRSSALSVHHARPGQVMAGDRLPYLELFDEKKKEKTDLYAWCSKPGFTLLVIGLLSQRDLYLLAKWIKSTYPALLNFYYLPPSSANEHIAAAFNLAKDGKKAVIVRPDLHIGYMNDVVDIELIEGYLKETVGWRKAG